MPSTITDEDVIVISIALTRNNSDPVAAAITYIHQVVVSGGADGSTRGRREKTWSPANVPANIQTQLNNLWDLAVSATLQREGL